MGVVPSTLTGSGTAPAVPGLKDGGLFPRLVPLHSSSGAQMAIIYGCSGTVTSGNSLVTLPTVDAVLGCVIVAPPSPRIQMEC